MSVCQAQCLILLAIGMPVVEKLDQNLWEVRTVLRNKISRVLFTIYANQIVLLHGFIKKIQKISFEDLELVQRRMNEIKRMII